MQIGSTSLYSPYLTQSRAEKSSFATTGASDQADGAKTRTFDFSNMTRSELRDAVTSLSKSGQMSLDESGGLLGMTGYAHMLDAGTGHSLSASEYEQERIDAFSVLKGGIEGAKSRGEYKSAEYYTTTLNALQRLQGTLAGVDLRA